MYLATIKYHNSRSSRTFKTQREAEDWLNTQNNNLESTTLVEQYDENWNLIGGYVYTQGEE